VLAWRLSNTQTTDFCIEAAQDTIHHYGKLKIFNADQGSQFTSLEFTQLLKDDGTAISMDGRGCKRALKKSMRIFTINVLKIFGTELTRFLQR
jgi:putative transposase